MDSEESDTTYLSEQVSHHPPVTAYYSENKATNFYFSGFCEPQ
jgi:hypothetical protein